MKNIMIIGGGFLQVPAIQKAKEMGLRTLVLDYDPRAPGIALADTPIIMSTKDIEGSVRVARDISSSMDIHGVLTVGTDASMTVAAVANALKLSGMRFEDAEAASNKIKMRHRFKKHQVPSPAFFEIWNIHDARGAAEKLGYPYVIKPSDNMGARGVRAVRNSDELEQAFLEAKDASPSGELIMEEFMEGDELSIDALVYEGKVLFMGIADRIIQHFPYFVEMGHTLPSIQPGKVIDAARDVMVRGIRALNIDNSAAKGDLKITPSGIKIGELASRLSGGFMSAYTFPLATGINSIAGAIEIALGIPPSDLVPKIHHVSAERGIIGPPGRILSIEGVDAARKIRHVKEVFIRAVPGDNCHVPRSNMDKIGNVIAVASTRKEAIAACEKALKSIHVTIGAPDQLNEATILKKAKERLKNATTVTTLFDHREYSGRVPGFGSVGRGDSYRANFEALRRFQIIPRYIHSVREPDTRCRVLGLELSTPILAAPITGMKTNLRIDLDEGIYNQWILRGCKSAGTLGMVGDGASPEKYKMGIEAICACGGWGIPIFKPRTNLEEVQKRIRAAERAGSIAVGMDIDAAGFITMKLKKQPVSPRSPANLKNLVRSTSLPFIIKGILSPADADRALDAGAAAIIVSNHGGRVMDALPGALDMLPEIMKVIRKKIPVLVDGGIRSGGDVLKCIALGATAVLVGRPLCIAAIGAEDEGVSFIIKKLTEELKTAMLLTGSKNLENISKKCVRTQG